MGASGSVVNNVAEVEPQGENQPPRKAGRVRQSIVLPDDPKGLVPSNVTEVTSNVFQIRVPHGAIPGSTFSAICQNRYVKVQVPDDAVAGDLIEIDLTGVVENTQGPPHAEVAGGEAGGSHDETQQQKMSTLAEIAEAERLKRAAGLFIKYGGKDKYEISMSQLEVMLEKEFQFPPGGDEIRKEMTIADVDKDQTISFEEFVHWITHLEMRIEVYKLQEQQRELMAQAQAQAAAAAEASKAHESARASGGRGDDDDDDDDDDEDTMVAQQRAVEDEERRIDALQAEQERVRLEVERQKEEFRLEIDALKREKERLEREKDDIAALQESSTADLSDYKTRNDNKLRLMEEHHRRNEIMIEKMKQDYLALNNRRKSEVSHKKEDLRRRLEAKRAARKMAKTSSDCHGCGGARRACGCERKVYHCKDCPDSKPCDSCGHK